MSVTPRDIIANGLWNIFTGRKKWQICCGKCQHFWIEKIPIAAEPCSAICPNCREQNLWSSCDFAEMYENEIACRAKARAAMAKLRRIRDE